MGRSRLTGCLSFSALVALLLAGFPSLLQAQSVEDGFDGVIQNTNKKFDKKPKKPDADTYLPSDHIEGEAVQPPKGLSQELVVFIKQVRFAGNRLYTREDFLICLNPVVGRKVSEAQLVGLSLCITQIYRAAGYSLSRAIIPPQDVDGGVLKVQVIEGYIGSYKIAGDDGRRYPTERYLDPLLGKRPLKQKQLERQLMLLNDLPGLMIEDTALEEQGELTGAFELTVYVKSWRLYSSSELDNRGTEAIGPLQSFQSIYLNSLFGRGSSLGISFSSIPDETETLNFGRISLDLPLGGAGLSLSGYISASQTRPSDYSEYYDTEYRNLSGQLMLNWAVIRERERNLMLGIGVFANTNVREDVYSRYVRDELRGINLTASMFFKDRFKGDNLFFANIRQGLDVAGASREGDNLLSRFDGDGVFTKLYLNYQRFQALDKNWSFQVEGALQLATEGLLSSEEFYLGGYRFGRGFESGLIGGDSGFGASLELRYYKPLDWGWLNGGQIYGFVDAGSIFDDGSQFANGIFLSSAGGGLRFYLDYGLEAEVELAFPLEKDFLTGIDDSAFYFRLKREFSSNHIGFDAF